MNSTLQASSEVELRRILAWGLEPVVLYLLKAHDDLFSWNGEKLGDYVHELFKVIVYRTRALKRFADVLDSQTHWTEVEKALVKAAHGRRLSGPRAGNRFPGPSPHRTPWWTGRNFLAFLIAVVSIVWTYLSPALFDVGRNRLKALAGGAGGGMLSAFWWFYGYSREDLGKLSCFAPAQPAGHGGDAESEGG